MATQKENKMSSRMKGAFGKMKSSKMKFNMTKPGNSGKSTRKLNNMFNRFKNKDDDQKWSSVLSGSWEIELPVGEFLNAPPPSSTDDSSQSEHNSKINDPNSVSSRQCPMIQVYENLKVISLPLPTDIANPHIHKKYLESKSITTNSTRVKIKSNESNNKKNKSDSSDKNNNYRIILVHFNKDETLENDISNIILEGNINITNFTIRWSDGSSWTKQGVTIKEDEEMEISYADTPSTNKHNNDIVTNQEINSLRGQLEIFKEKEKMAKSQTQATMGQYADLSNEYARLTTEKDKLENEYVLEKQRLEKDYNDISEKHNKLEEDFSKQKSELDANNIELEEARNNMVYKQQQEIQSKLTKLKKENSEYSESIKLQQERILSLQDQLQTSHIATRQYTKTIEDLETKIKIINNEKLEIKQVLNEMNNKFVTSQTNLDDAKHKEMIVTDKHEKQIKLLNDKHQIEIKKLEHGFQETLRQNERKMQEMQTLRNSYEKKNASLTKDVKKLIIQLEKQANNTYNNSVTKQINLSSINIVDEEEIINKLKSENKQLTEELMRKSQSLVDALRALAEFNRNPVDITKAITQNLSHAKKYIYSNENGNLNDIKGLEHLEHKVGNNVKLHANNINNSSPASQSSVNSGIVIGAKYSIDDLNDLNAIGLNNTTKQKFNRFKNKFGNKMKEQITKIQQKKINEEIMRRKMVLNEEENLNELNAKSVIKESEKVLIMKTKQQLNTQCEELQGLANELSSTIEQKEVILESLRFANTYLGKRVIALEKLMSFPAGKEIDNQEQLIADALNISPNENNENKKDEIENNSINDKVNGDLNEKKEDIVVENETIIEDNSKIEEENNIDLNNNNKGNDEKENIVVENEQNNDVIIESNDNKVEENNDLNEKNEKDNVVENSDKGNEEIVKENDNNNEQDEEIAEQSNNIDENNKPNDEDIMDANDNNETNEEIIEQND